MRKPWADEAEGDPDQYLSWEVVDEQALIEVLQKGRILAAGLDTQAKEPADPANPSSPCRM